MTKCRCGYDPVLDDPNLQHPCHRCGQPAKERFYSAQPAHLAGVQVKFAVSQTWACDSCWTWFKNLGPVVDFY